MKYYALIIGFAASTVVHGAQAQALRTDEEPAESSRPHRINLEMGWTSVYESNVNHDVQPLASTGSVPNVGLRYRNRPDKPTFEIIYRGARHAYTNTDQWDRFSNYLSLQYSPRVSDGVYLESTVEVSLKGSSEDRDLSDQLQYQQTIEYRPLKNTRLHLYGTARFKRFAADPASDAFKPNAGFVFEQKLPRDRSLEVDTRYEINRPQTPRSRYDRWSVECQYERPGLGRGSQLEFKFRQRWKQYERLIELEDGSEVQRRDLRWSAGVTYEQRFLRRLLLTVEYEYESRSSNDIDKVYTSHVLMTGLSLTL